MADLKRLNRGKVYTANLISAFCFENDSGYCCKFQIKIPGDQEYMFLKHYWFTDGSPATESEQKATKDKFKKEIGVSFENIDQVIGSPYLVQRCTYQGNDYLEVRAKLNRPGVPKIKPENRRLAELWDMACEIRKSFELAFARVCELYAVNDREHLKFIHDFFISGILDQCAKDQDSCKGCPFYSEYVSWDPTPGEQCAITWLALETKKKMEVINGTDKERSGE